MKTDRYQIEVRKSKRKDEKYSIYYQKMMGDVSGGACGAKDKEEVMERIREIIHGWSHYDSILGRDVAKVTERNLEFISDCPEIIKAEVLGNKTLASFD